MAKRALYQHSLNILIQPILDYNNNGFNLQTDNNELWCYPFISVMLRDLPENAAVTLTFNFVNCNCPCHQCLVEGENLNNVKLTDDEIILRSPLTMKAFIEQGLAQQYSLHNMENIFWKYP